MAQGYEAGGHTGEIASMVLVPEVVDAVGERVPVLAAGGIGSGRQIARGARAGRGRGVDGLVLADHRGVRSSAPARPRCSEALLAAGSSDTVRSRIYSGKPARLLRNRWTEAWAAPDAPQPLPMPLQNLLVGEAHRRLMEAGDPDVVAMPVGQIVGRMNEVRPVAEVMATLVAEAEETLNGSPSCNELREADIVIDAPADVVWRAMLDLDNYPQWNPFIVRVDRPDGRPPQVGDALTLHVRFHERPGGARSRERITRDRARRTVAGVRVHRACCTDEPALVHGTPDPASWSRARRRHAATTPRSGCRGRAHVPCMPVAGRWQRAASAADAARRSSGTPRAVRAARRHVGEATGTDGPSAVGGHARGPAPRGGAESTSAAVAPPRANSLRLAATKYRCSG